MDLSWCISFYEFYKLVNYNDLKNQCFKKNGEIKNENVRGIKKEAQELLKLLHKHHPKIQKEKDLDQVIQNEIMFFIYGELYRLEQTVGYDRFKELLHKCFTEFKNKGLLLTKEQLQEKFPDEGSDLYKLHEILVSLKVKTGFDWRKIKTSYEARREVANIEKMKPIEPRVKQLPKLNNDEELMDLEYEDYQREVMNQESDFTEQIMEEEQLASQHEYINRPKPAQEDDGYDNVEDYFEDSYYNYFGESTFNQIDSPDYSIGVTVAKDKNNNPIINANLSGKNRVRKDRVNEVLKLFEEHFLKSTHTNVIYRYHFRGVGWRTYKLRNKEEMEKMFESLKNYGATNVEEVYYSASSSYYEQHELPKIEFVDYVRIEVENFDIKDSKKKTYKDKGGEFFPYRLLPEYCYDQIDQTLSLSQIFLGLSKAPEIIKPIVYSIPLRKKTEEFRIVKGNLIEVFNEINKEYEIKENDSEEYKLIMKKRREKCKKPILEKLKGIERDEFKYNCFCYALKQSGKISDKLINQIQTRCYGVYVKMKDVKDLCKDLNIKINLSEYTPNIDHKFRKTIINPEGSIEVNLGLIRTEDMKGDHYFINCLTPYSTFYLKHRQEIINYAIDNNKDITKLYAVEKYDKRYNCYCAKGKNVKYATMFDLILYVKEQNGFYPYSLNDTLNIYSNFDRYIANKEIEDLEYDNSCVRIIKSKGKRKEEEDNNDDDNDLNDKFICEPVKYEYFYADFEASTQGWHKPYAIAYFSTCHDYNINSIYGYGCEEKFLDELSKSEYTPVVFFHNLAYDGRFLAQYGIRKIIKKAGKILTMELSYKGHTIILRDSYAMITAPLKDFPSMFGIENIQKELYPYNYYTEERVNSNIGIIDEAGKYETIPWSKEDYKLFNENIDKIPGCRIDENHFRMDLYCEFYCKQDVNILMKGHMKFRELVEWELNLDIYDIISISSLANKYFTNNIYCKISNLYEYSGHVRKFIQGCVKGGRCMTRQNKKWHCTERLYDYDACSLYPSAVHRLKLATGAPKVIPKGYLGNSKKLFDHLMKEQQLEPTKERFISAFIVDIEITKVGKELAFPIIMQKTKKGNLNCNECCCMRVDNIELEDLIKFQQIEFTIKRGYYWSGPKSDLFSKEMKRIYDLRVQYKKQKNPLQLVLKLLMNSVYGKTIQLEIKTEQVYCYNTAYRKDKKGNTIKVHEAARFNRKNNKNIKEYYAINKNITCFEVEKGFDDFYVPNFIGVQILSMSKRIMNEVMCLAEDLGIMIYYQDTDSMHIPVKDIPLLEQKYKELYGRVLRGSDMGQFHPDFESNKIKGELQSVESYFLGKKAYCDKLQNENGEVDYHLRLKGIPNNLLESEYEDPLELYKFMFEGGEYKFNLLKLKPSFEMTKDMKIKTRSEFTRQIKFD